MKLQYSLIKANLMPINYAYISYYYLATVLKSTVIILRINIDAMRQTMINYSTASRRSFQ